MDVLNYFRKCPSLRLKFSQIVQDRLIPMSENNLFSGATGFLREEANPADIVLLHDKLCYVYSSTNDAWTVYTRRL